LFQAGIVLGVAVGNLLEQLVYLFERLVLARIVGFLQAGSIVAAIYFCRVREACCAVARTTIGIVPVVHLAAGAVIANPVILATAAQMAYRVLLIVATSTRLPWT